MVSPKFIPADPKDTTLLKKIVAERAGRRGCCTRLISTLDGLLAGDPIDLDPINASTSELKRQRDSILELDTSIVEILDPDSFELEFAESSELQVKISLVLTRCEKVLDKPRQSQPKQTTKNIHDDVRLPRVNLIKFSGDPLTYSKFWDLFKTSIHDRADISTIVKFQYLMTQVEGEAEQLLSGFDNTEAQYQEAIELLTETYGKKKNLIRARLSSLFDLPQPEATSKSLSDFRSLYEGHIRALSSLGCDVTNSG